MLPKHLTYIRNVAMEWLNHPQLFNEFTQIREDSYIGSGIKFPSLRNNSGNLIHYASTLIVGHVLTRLKPFIHRGFKGAMLIG